LLLFDLGSYPSDPGTGLLSIYAVSPPLWAAVALATLAVTVWLAVRGSPYAWVAAAVLMYVGPPRVVTSYLGFILVAVQLVDYERRAVAVAMPMEISTL
jgi:hypothetical protein